MTASKERLRLKVNDDVHEIVVAVNKTLLEVLREELGLTGTKHGCELGECGTCTVLVDGEPMLSCLLLPLEVQDSHIETVESLAVGGQPHELQVAFAALGASQCGYCTPGIMMSAAALLEEIPMPNVEEIKEHLAGNLCRCTGYLQIIEAIQTAGKRIVELRSGATDNAGDGEPSTRGRAPAHGPERAAR